MVTSQRPAEPGEVCTCGRRCPARVLVHWAHPGRLVWSFRRWRRRRAVPVLQRSPPRAWPLPGLRAGPGLGTARRRDVKPARERCWPGNPPLPRLPTPTAPCAEEWSGVSQRRDPAQPGLFELTARPAGEAPARWTYPCGLCNGLEVDEAGGLCETCSPIPFRKPVRRQTSAKTPKTAMRTAAKPARRSTRKTKAPARGWSPWLLRLPGSRTSRYASAWSWSSCCGPPRAWRRRCGGWSVSPWSGWPGSAAIWRGGCGTAPARGRSG